MDVKVFEAPDESGAVTLHCTNVVCCGGVVLLRVSLPDVNTAFNYIVSSGSYSLKWVVDDVGIHYRVNFLDPPEISFDSLNADLVLLKFTH